ncbi:Indoleamine 2-3-dioxygenase [Penicillium argentinense]|uniref:Indoleamine 2,3-dioxygenase n=1 Tax=Penicillium argentinense TaxID=1131581 RepID=A0A9W9EYP1_9EURO|nr:Indoleamine 2-3-dioxygenase [Penicillium argentinense]KAJ5090305.1 Indoleamine 2-3-dioxygenase [Penicillium argentinense]
MDTAVEYAIPAYLKLEGRTWTATPSPRTTASSPTGLPLSRLSAPYYAPWEDLASDLPRLIQTGQIRPLIDNLPVLTTASLQSEPEWRRAYSVLGFLTHAYIWGGEKPQDPLLEISAHLGLPPCATYAALTLWNWTTFPEADVTNPDNLSLLTSFTGTKDEEWFIVISVAIEAKGARVVPLMLDAIAAATANDAPRLTALLCRFSDILEDLTVTLKRMYEKNDPNVFFHQLRPFLAGSKNMAAAGLPDGVFYDLGNGQGEWGQYSGGSNAQSSLIQTFDIFLGVNHSATGDVKPAGTGYIQEMRKYMPSPHRNFLQTLAKLTNTRRYILSSTDQSLKEAYNSAVLSLSSFRDAHIQIVSRYIIIPAKSRAPEQKTERVNLATASSQVKGLEDKNPTGLYGTGGTSLIPFLKETRDTTKAATC